VEKPAGSGARLRRVRVLGNLEIAPGARLLRVERNSEFVPGQNVAVTVDPLLPARSYSIASGTGDPVLELLYTVLPGGALTPRLARLREGDGLYVSEPFGVFSDSPGPAWWVAGGTGVAPFRAMVRSGLVEGKTLVVGSRRPDRLYFREELAARLPSAFHPCSSALAEPSGGIEPGRLTDLLRRLAPPADRRVLVCGGAEMVVAVRDGLLEAGVPFTNILAEIFF
jgi:ferredoxin/flavodoxin---NADP+ reductase